MGSKLIVVLTKEMPVESYSMLQYVNFWFQTVNFVYTHIHTKMFFNIHVTYFMSRYS